MLSTKSHTLWPQNWKTHVSIKSFSLTPLFSLALGRNKNWYQITLICHLMLYHRKRYTYIYLLHAQTTILLRKNLAKPNHTILGAWKRLGWKEIQKICWYMMFISYLKSSQVAIKLIRKFRNYLRRINLYNIDP